MELREQPAETEMPDSLRRRLVIAGACLAAGIPVARYMGVGKNYPFGDPLTVDIRDLPEGRMRTLDWQERPVFILRRSAAMLAQLAAIEPQLADPESRASFQPDICRNRHRSLRPEIFVAMGVCTHKGCLPTLNLPGDAAQPGFFLCPCHTSKYDLAGRVYSRGPAPANLVIPAYRMEGEGRLVLGEEA
jgi:ubiquinol-cytochrome c reductase iron-sulfur subunit